jgi:hypothetical protein
MAVDAQSRSSIYQKLVPTLGEHDANVLMSQFPSIEADELVTRQFLRAELAELRLELRGEFCGLESRISERFRQQTMWMAGRSWRAPALRPPSCRCWAELPSGVRPPPAARG